MNKLKFLQCLGCLALTSVLYGAPPAPSSQPAYDGGNTGWASTLIEPVAVNNIVATVVSEESQGNTDLNGDGDTTDILFAYVDTNTGQRTLTRYAIGDSSQPFNSYQQLTPFGDHIGFLVDERASHNTDFDGDGGLTKYAFFVLDTTTGTVVNMHKKILAMKSSMNFCCVIHPENTITGDLNGDGWLAQNMVAYYDNHLNLTYTSINTYIGNIEITDDGLSMKAVEHQQPSQDVNGDGDTTDMIFYYYKFDTNQLHNSGLACSSFYVDSVIDNRVSVASRSLVAFVVSESKQWNRDLNGDGDTTDGILYFLTTDNGSITNTRLAVGDTDINSFVVFGEAPCVNGRQCLFGIKESSQGTDINGDGDTDDIVLMTINFATTASINNLRVAGRVGGVGETSYIYFVNEAEQNSTDLNNDGDTLNSIIHIHAFGSNTSFNTGLSIKNSVAHPWSSNKYCRIRQNQAYVMTNEIYSGMTDLNHNGVIGETLVIRFDLSAMSQTVFQEPAGTSPTIHFSRRSPSKIAYLINENMTNIDYNNDGDLMDIVIGTIKNTQNTVSVQNTDTRFVNNNLEKFYSNSSMPCISTEISNNQDLNGDGDLQDIVTYIIK